MSNTCHSESENSIKHETRPKLVFKRMKISDQMANPIRSQKVRFIVSFSC